MKIYHDWEFLETGNSIYPISVGMVSETGLELYYEFSTAPWEAIYKHDWLVKHVVPQLSMTENVFVNKTKIRNEVYYFLLDCRNNSTEDLELWGYYSSYDHVCLGQLFGRMIDLPDFVPMYTNDLMQEFRRLGYPSYPRKNESVHNALSDAKDIKDMHQWLIRYENE